MNEKTMTQKVNEMANAKTTTKRTWIDFLTNNLAEVKGDLADRVKYALDMFKKDMKKVTKADLEDLSREVAEFFTSTTTPVAESSPKPKITKKTGAKAPAKKSEPEDETDDEPVEDEEEEAPKKSTKTAKEKSTKSSKNTVKTGKSSITSTLPDMAQYFPDTLENKDLGTLVACKNEYTTYEEIYKALEAGKTLYFACYWSPRQIKEFSYGLNHFVKEPKAFPNDLDLLLAVAPCETIDRVWCMSQYTEAMFRFEDTDFEYVEDKDPQTGEKFSIRVSAGLEFEIYRPEDEDIYTDED